MKGQILTWLDIGRRVETLYEHYSDGSWTHQWRKRHLYDGWRMIAEIDADASGLPVTHGLKCFDRFAKLRDRLGEGNQQLITFIDEAKVELQITLENRLAADPSLENG